MIKNSSIKLKVSWLPYTIRYTYLSEYLKRQRKNILKQLYNII